MRVVSLFMIFAMAGVAAKAAVPDSATNALAAEVEAVEPSTHSVSNTETNVPYKIPPNRILEFGVPLTSAAKLAIASSKNPTVDFARAAIAVPSGFDPEIPTPILLVSASSDGEASSIRVMPAFTNVALRLGWIVMAVDGPYGKPPNDNPPWRWGLISSLLDHVNKTWPGSKKWPIVAAGVSGGAKWSGVIGAILAQKGYNLVGVFMGGVNQDMASKAAQLYDPAVRFKRTPIYLSSGTKDKIATPAHHEEVKESLISNGFAKVRLESFEGGHALSDEELRKALGWFLEVYSKPPEENARK
ncbi:MAG: hypothetical protein ACTHMT_00340 [Verrucomicrobiota bacterium]